MAFFAYEESVIHNCLLAALLIPRSKAIPSLSEVAALKYSCPVSVILAKFCVELKAFIIVGIVGVVLGFPKVSASDVC